MKFILPFIFVFLVAFDPQIPFFPNGVGFTVIVFFVLLIPLVLKLRDPGAAALLKQSMPFLVIYFVALLFILFRIFLGGGDNVDFVLSWFKAFVVFLAVMLTMVVFFKDGLGHRFIMLLVGVYIANSVVNFFAGSFSELFAFLDLFRSASISGREASNPYRGSFISGSGYYSIGTAYGLIFFLVAFHVVNSGLVNYRVKSAILSVALVVIGVTGFVAARTSFFAVAFASVYLLGKRLSYFLLAAVIGAFLVYFVINMSVMEPYKLWMLSFFNMENDASATHLINQMYYWPGSDIFLFGRGVVNDGMLPYTDGGYMQDILFGGFLYLVIKMAFLGVFLICFFKKFPLFVLLFTLTVLAFHFKGLFIFSNAQGMAALYFIYYYLADLNARSLSKRTFL